MASLQKRKTNSSRTHSSTPVSEQHASRQTLGNLCHQKCEIMNLCETLATYVQVFGYQI